MSIDDAELDDDVDDADECDELSKLLWLVVFLTVTTSFEFMISYIRLFKVAFDGGNSGEIMVLAILGDWLLADDADDDEPDDVSDRVFAME